MATKYLGDRVRHPHRRHRPRPRPPHQRGGPERVRARRAPVGRLVGPHRVPRPRRGEDLEVEGRRAARRHAGRAGHRPAGLPLLHASRPTTASSRRSPSRRSRPRASRCAASSATRSRRATRAARWSTRPRSRRHRRRFWSALADDLNAPQALAVVSEVAKDDALAPADKWAVLPDADRALGFGLADAVAPGGDDSGTDPRIDGLVAEREAARAGEGLRHRRPRSATSWPPRASRSSTRPPAPPGAGPSPPPRFSRPTHTEVCAGVAGTSWGSVGEEEAVDRRGDLGDDPRQAELGGPGRRGRPTRRDRLDPPGAGGRRGAAPWWSQVGVSSTAVASRAGPSAPSDRSGPMLRSSVCWPWALSSSDCMMRSSSCSDRSAPVGSSAVATSASAQRVCAGQDAVVDADGEVERPLERCPGPGRVLVHEGSALGHARHRLDGRAERGLRDGGHVGGEAQRTSGGAGVGQDGRGHVRRPRPARAGRPRRRPRRSPASDRGPHGPPSKSPPT